MSFWHPPAGTNEVHACSVKSGNDKSRTLNLTINLPQSQQDAVIGNKGHDPRCSCYHCKPRSTAYESATSFGQSRIGSHGAGCHCTQCIYLGGPIRPTSRTHNEAVSGGAHACTVETVQCKPNCESDLEVNVRSAKGTFRPGKIFNGISDLIHGIGGSYQPPPPDSPEK